MANRKRKHQPKIISNRRARYDYLLDDSLIVGIELTGAETKALRMGHGHLRGAYATIKDSQLWLLNATITGSSGINIDESTQTRTRRLLAKRREINQLAQAKEQGLTIVPLEFLTGGRFIKLRIASGRGKKRFDKRETIKKRESDRRMQRIVR